MTPTEINNLKEGDKFTVEYTVKSKEDTECIIASVIINGMPYSSTFEIDCAALKTATLVTPRPTFEVGDTVRIVRDPITKIVHGVHGCCWTRDDGCIGTIETITPSECIAGIDYLAKHGHAHCSISLHCLELVKKAVKDKYSIEENSYGWSVVSERWSHATFYKNRHPNAKAAAEAECARLNKEWRKQQEQKGE